MINTAIDFINKGIDLVNDISNVINNVSNLFNPSPDDSRDERKRYLCKYKVRSLVIKKEDEKIVMDPSNILTIEYMNDYEFNLMALLKISLRIDIRKKLWILKNKRDITVKFELVKIGMDLDADNFITSEEECINQEFGVHFNDEDESIDIKTLEERLKKNEGTDFNMNDIEGESYYESQNTLEIFLFHPKLLKASRVSFQRIYEESTLQNMVGEMLTDTKHVNVLMSKFENDEIYKELIVPANPLYKILIYLDQYYGLYKKGALIYYDIDALYIINLNDKVTAKREEEIAETTIVVPKYDSTAPGNAMERVEEDEKNYIVISEMEINPQKFSIGQNVQSGSTARVVVTDEVDIETKESDQSYVDDRNSNITYIRKENKFTGDVIKARMEENECIMYIDGSNLDINAFTPNKVFNIAFEETSKHEKYGKMKFRMSYSYHYIRLESENYMSASHKFVLKKTSGEVNEES